MTSPPVIDLDNLERLARAATPGPYVYDHEHSDAIRSTSVGSPVVAAVLIGDDPEPRLLVFNNDMDFIAASNPAVVLELVRRLRAAERRSRHLAERLAVATARWVPGDLDQPEWERCVDVLHEDDVALGR